MIETEASVKGRVLDIGDFIGVKGFVFRTQTGEISVHAQSLTRLSTSLLRAM